MKSRFAHVFSRLSLVSVVAVSALGATACSKPATADDTATAAAAESKAAAAPAAEASAAHGPGYHLFRQIEQLDLRPAQRDTLGELEQNLRADLAPHRETVRQVAMTLANGIEAGRIDARESAAQQAALMASLADMRASVASALDQVHDTLDADQRLELVTTLRAQRWNEHGRAENAKNAEATEAADNAERDKGLLAKLAFEISLTDEQKQAIRDAVQRGTDELFPNRRIRREMWETKMKALGDSFMTEDFEAADYDLASGAEDGIKSFSEAASRAIEISGSVLSDGQRKSVATMLRNHAEKI
jgi:Spy/CpxP family protein refolding chaperone